MTQACEFSISRLYGSQEGEVVRIEAKATGGRLLGRIEVTLVGFAAALMGTAAVPASFSTTRDTGAPRPSPSAATQAGAPRK